MKKSDLIARLTLWFPDLVHADVRAAVDQLLRAMTSTLAAGDRIEVRDFGSFSVSQRPSRTGRNPRTGVTVEVPAKHVVHWRAGKQMLNLVNPKARIGVLDDKTNG